MDEASNISANAQLRNHRKRWLAIVIGAFVVIGGIYGAYWATALRYEQSTDDAYVSGNVVQITPQIPGTVVSIAADDTQFVKAGDTLVQLDPADAKIALEQADAKLGKTVREVRRSSRRKSMSAAPTSRGRRTTSSGASASRARARSPARSCSTRRTPWRARRLR